MSVDRHEHWVRGKSSRGVPIKVSIAGVVVLCMVALAAAILTIGWRGASEALVQTSMRAVGDAATLVNERARRMLEPNQATLRQLADSSLTEATTTAQRLERLRMLADELSSNTLVTAIYVGYASGDFFLVRPLDVAQVRARFAAPPKANFLVQAVTTEPSGQRRGEWLYFTANLQLLERRPQPDYQFDPRERPWFLGAQRANKAALTEPYVFFSTRQVGVTLSQESLNRKAIFGVDLVLDDLSNSLSDMGVTPSSELALVSDRGEVLAYRDMQKALVQQGDSFIFRTVDELGVPPLTEYHRLAARNGAVTTFELSGRRWVGMSQAFNVWPERGIRLEMVVPADELLGDLVRQRDRLVIIIGGVILVLLPLGWWAGTSIGRSVDQLSVQASRMAHFDFSEESAVSSHVREVNQLGHVMNDLGGTIQTFLDISQGMATEPDVDQMLDRVLQQLVHATRSRSAAVFLWDFSQQRMTRAAMAGFGEDTFPSEFGYADGREVRLMAREVAGDHRQIELELRGRTGHLQGLLVLTHRADASHTDAAFRQFTHQLSGMLAVSIETRQLMAAQKELLDAIIRLMADAIDAKSPYTGGHCERVPQLVTLLVDRMSAETQGPYADFRLSDDQRYEFYLAAWLHDCGKVTSPEHIVDKATKLELIHNRIHEVRTRFEVLWRDAEIEHLTRMAQGVPETDSTAQRDLRQQQLRDDFAFVAQCNVGGEFMADEAVARLRGIAAQRWMRHFDDRLGLSQAEVDRLDRCRLTPPVLPVAEPLLADRPEHVVPWNGRKPPVEKGDPANVYGFDMKLPDNQQNMGEVYNLSIRRGTLTDEDRFKINDHIVQTYVMLKGLPWPAHLQRVPEIAASHHEKMDGQGYPRKLPGDQLSTLDKAMALADVFEALTAADRPYKAPKTLTESLRIMAFMCKDRHLDTELFRYFLRSGVWREFAQRFMQPQQIDLVDVDSIEKLLPAQDLSC